MAEGGEGRTGGGWARVDDVVVREVAGETLLVPVRASIADMQFVFAMTPVAAHLWHLLDGTRDLPALAESVCAAFDVERERAIADVTAFLDELGEAGLVRRT